MQGRGKKGAQRTPPGGSVGHIVMGLERLGAAIRSQAWNEAGSLRLSPTQRSILQFLAQAPAGVRLSELAQRLMVSVPTVSDAVNTLVGKGLVDKARAEGDGRALALVLTDAGKLETKRATGADNPLHEAVASLGPVQQQALLTALVNLIEAMQDQGAISVARTCVSCSFFRAHVHPKTDRPHHCAFVDAPLANLDLRVHCAEHELVPAEDLKFSLRRFRAG